MALASSSRAGTAGSRRVSKARSMIALTFIHNILLLIQPHAPSGSDKRRRTSLKNNPVPYRKFTPSACFRDIQSSQDRFHLLWYTGLRFPERSAHTNRGTGSRFSGAGTEEVYRSAPFVNVACHSVLCSWWSSMHA